MLCIQWLTWLCDPITGRGSIPYALPKYYVSKYVTPYGNILIVTSGVNAVRGLWVPFYVADQEQVDIFKLVLVNSLMLEIRTFQCNNSEKYCYDCQYGTLLTEIQMENTHIPVKVSLQNKMGMTGVA